LYAAGKIHESYDMFGRIQAFSTISGADAYVMVARGIFKETTKSRPMPGVARAAAEPVAGISDGCRQEECRDALNAYLKPYLRG